MNPRSVVMITYELYIDMDYKNNTTYPNLLSLTVSNVSLTRWVGIINSKVA